MFDSLKPKTEKCSGFEDFVSDGLLSLTGNDGAVPEQILRDTGAKDSFILASALPFSQNSETGDCVLVRGMGIATLYVPLHKARLCLVLWMLTSTLGLGLP